MDLFVSSRELRFMFDEMKNKPNSYAVRRWVQTRAPHARSIMWPSASAANIETTFAVCYDQENPFDSIITA